MILQKMIHKHCDIGSIGIPVFEELDEFISRVSAEATIIDSDPNFEVINISYIEYKSAVIVYRQLEEEKK